MPSAEKGFWSHNCCRKKDRNAETPGAEVMIDELSLYNQKIQCWESHFTKGPRGKPTMHSRMTPPIKQMQCHECSGSITDMPAPQ